MKDKRCLDYRKAIKESEKGLLALERHQTKALLRDRMRFLRLLKSGACPSQAQAGRAIGLGLRASEKLWRKYREEGLQGLLAYPYKGTQGRLSREDKQALCQELLNDTTQTIEQARHWVAEHLGVHYSVSGMHYVLGQMKVKKKTGRPVHQHKDTKGEQRFKKNAFPS